MQKIKDLELVIASNLKRFESNSLLKLLNGGNLKIAHYHSLLKTIYHQTYHSPITFAKAGINTPDCHEEIRHYLFTHAGEEKDHYNWVINDLKNTGFTGKMPNEAYPTSACLRYISLNYFSAEKYPIARLGIASVLESFGARYGKQSAMKIADQLKLKPNQLAFFFGHGDTDVGHTQDILNVLGRAQLTDSDWEPILYFAEQAGQGYCEMYEEAFNSVS